MEELCLSWGLRGILLQQPARRGGGPAGRTALERAAAAARPNFPFPPQTRLPPLHIENGWLLLTWLTD